MGSVDTHGADITPTSLQNNDDYVTHREERHLVQFLMALCNDLDVLWRNILHHQSYPSVDVVVSELLAEDVALRCK